MIVTLGARGCCARTPTAPCCNPAFAVEAVDTTAAGDTFCGALVAALGGAAPRCGRAARSQRRFRTGLHAVGRTIEHSDACGGRCHAGLRRRSTPGRHRRPHRLLRPTSDTAPMNSSSDDAPGSTAPPNGRTPVKTEYKFSHVTTQRYLPMPGKAPGWPFAEIGQWKIDVNGTADDWIAELIDWRREHLTRIGYDDAKYRRPELQWAQRNFVHAQMMVEDRYFYDPVAGKYTVDRYLDDLEQRFGGIDSVLHLVRLPEHRHRRPQPDRLAHDLPGGVEGLRGAVDDFHRRGVKVFLPTMPWDNGTRERKRTDWQAMARAGGKRSAPTASTATPTTACRALSSTHATRSAARSWCSRSRRSAPRKQLIWNVQSWGKKVPDRRGAVGAPSSSGSSRAT